MNSHSLKFFGIDHLLSVFKGANSFSSISSEEACDFQIDQNKKAMSCFGRTAAAATNAPNANTQGHTDVSKTKAQKELNTLFANDELDVNRTLEGVQFSWLLHACLNSRSKDGQRRGIVWPCQPCIRADSG